MAFHTGEPLKTNYTEQLCEFVQNLNYENIPPEVLERAKLIAIQTIGVALAVNGLPVAEKAASLGKRCGGRGNCEGDATLWIDGSKTTVPGAAFANSTLADALDWEDCAWTGHPSASLVPVAFACAEAEHKSGKDFLTAIVAAYEAYTRIAMVVQPPADWPSHIKGWGITGWQIFAAVIPAAKLLGLDAEKINQAIGFGVTSCPIPGALHHLTMSDAYHYEHGFRSMEGVMAAFNAEAGVDNYTDAFDDPWAFENHLTASPDNSWYTKDLGTHWLTMETLLKHWPANMWIQTPLELLDSVMTKNRLTKDDVAEVVIDPPVIARMEFYPEGYNALTQAQFSMPFMLASYICDPTPSCKWLYRERLAAKVHGGPSEPLFMPQCFKDFQKGKDGHHPIMTLTIKTNDGKEYSETMEKHLGHPYNMMSLEQIADRFRIQASASMSSERLEQLLDKLIHVEDCEDIAEISALLRKDLA